MSATLASWMIVWAGNAGVVSSAAAQSYEKERERLIREDILTGGVDHPGVLQAIRDTPRHEFVSKGQRHLAYFDMALPIGYRQTISSPYIVAFMTQSLDPQPTDRVLEIGTGSGYQAAVLSPLVKEVYSIEIVPELGRRAEKTLKRLGYKNIFLKIGDGYLGWAEHAPFDKIMVTCSPEHVPRPLIDQLAEGGTMVIPVGEQYQQILYRFTKKDGELQREPLQSTLFVPMTGRAQAEIGDPRAASGIAVVNGGFEEPASAEVPLPGWYYTRQVECVRDETAPEGRLVARFHNSEPGRSSHALQGLALDGRQIREVRLSAWVHLRDVHPALGQSAQPRVVLSFFDRQRDTLGDFWLGPWQGDLPWQKFERVVRVPKGAREAILRCGLFGATGELRLDDVRLQILDGTPPP